MATLSGVITVMTAGTAVQGPSSPAYYGPVTFILTADSDNTGEIYVGNVSGDVASTNGMPVQPGSSLYLRCKALDAYYFDAEVNGETIGWVVAGD